MHLSRPSSHVPLYGTPSRLHALLLALLSLVSCLTPGMGLAIDRLEHPEAYADHDAVILEDQGLLRLTSPYTHAQGYTFSVHKRTQILAPRALQLGRIAVPLSPGEELKSLKAVAIAAPSSLELRSKPPTVTQEDVILLSLAGENNVLYTDTKVALVDVPELRVGDVLDVHYTVQSSAPLSLPHWSFNGPYPVLESRFSVEAPADWTLKWGYTEYGQPAALAPTLESFRAAAMHRMEGTQHILFRPLGIGRWQRLTWSMKDQPALEREAFGLPFSRIMRRLTLSVANTGRRALPSTLPSWGALADWYRTRSPGRYTLPAATAEKLLNRLRALETSRTAEPQHTAAASEVPATPTSARSKRPMPADEVLLFEYVRDQIRYVAIHEGLGAVRPHNAAEVLGTLHGDCKDKATLLVALYRQRGFEAYPVLIATRSHPIQDTTVPTVSAFDHAIVALKRGEKLHFLDPTATQSTFERLPYEDQGQQTLVVLEQGGQQVITPISGPEQNRHVAEFSLDVLTGKLELLLTATGEEALDWYGLDDDGWSVKRALWFTLRDLVRVPLEGIEQQDVEKQQGQTDTTVTVRAVATVPLLKLTATAPVSPPGAPLLLPIGPVFQVLPEIRIPKERHSPVLLGHPRTHVERVRIRVPPHLKPGPLPPDLEKAFPFAHYTRRIRQEGDMLTVERTLTITQHSAEAGALDLFRQLGELILEDARRMLTFYKEP